MSANRLSGLIKTVGKQPTTPTPSTSVLPLDQINDRTADTRPLNQAHVEALADSIGAIGLIQPIAVDNKGRLLAGGHRRAAIALLQQNDPTAFDKWFSAGVPVHRFSFDAAEDEALALAIEATENEKRRDYTPGEVRELADRLIAAGYRVAEGRPKKGEKSLIPSLSVIVGKSHRTIHRYLDESPADKKTLPSVRVSAKQPPTIAEAITAIIDRDDCPEDLAKVLRSALKKLG